MSNISEIIKAGVITPSSVQLSGRLTPAQAKTAIDAIIDSSAFLKLITTDKMGRLTKERSTFDLQRGILSRHITGVTPSNKQGIEVVGCKLDASAGVSLYSVISDDTLADNAGNSAFETEVFNSFAKSFANDICHLGFIGKSDNTNANSPFNELAKGWIEIAKTDSKTEKAIDISGSVSDALLKITQLINSDIKGSCSIIISGVDFEKYQLEIAKTHPSALTAINSNAKTFLGYPLIVENYMPQGTLLATPLANIILGFATEMRRDRWYDQEQSALKYKFVAYLDYEFDIKKYVSIVTFDDTESEDA